LISHVTVPLLHPGALECLEKATVDGDAALSPVLRTMALETMAADNGVRAVGRTGTGDGGAADTPGSHPSRRTSI